MDDFSSS
jgi:hypothetical protein